MTELQGERKHRLSCALSRRKSDLVGFSAGLTLVSNAGTTLQRTLNTTPRPLDSPPWPYSTPTTMNRPCLNPINLNLNDVEEWCATPLLQQRAQRNEGEGAPFVLSDELEELRAKRSAPAVGAEPRREQVRRKGAADDALHRPGKLQRVMDEAVVNTTRIELAPGAKPQAPCHSRPVIEGDGAKVERL